MAKPTNKKRLNKELQFEEPIFISSKKSNSNISIDNDYDKRILIVCEGPTEYSYFEGLCNFYDVRNSNNFNIVVLPEKQDDNTSGYKGSSIKGLVYEAMKKNHIDGKYDETWIVTDNDECNSYKLNNESLQRIKEFVPEIVFQRLSDFQLFEMNVRDYDIEKNEKNRIRYFLNRLEYESFLKEQILLTQNDLSFLDIIIDHTTKNNDFELFFDSNSGNYFHDTNVDFIIVENLKYEKKYFDKNWKNYKVAYTSIAFEHWILLHFENNNSSFYNSREIIKYFDRKNYFNTVFKEDIGFEKGYHLYKLLKENNEVVKSFFKLSHNAILNNLILNNEIQYQINSKTRFFEVNPFSDVYKLTTFLLNKTYVEQAFQNIKVSFFDFKDIIVDYSEEIIKFLFIYDGNLSILKNQVIENISLKDSNNSNIEIDFEFNFQNIITKNDNVEIQIKFKNPVNFHCFLEFTNEIKGIENQLIWVIS